jgi:hypothetical protein
LEPDFEMSAPRSPQKKTVELVDICREVLLAHAQTLQRLAALLGEERLLEFLEQQPQPEETEGTDLGVTWNECFRERNFAPNAGPAENAYQSLEGTVKEAGIAAFLEFYLWAYPPYRTLIESPMTLHAALIPGEMAIQLVEGLVKAADLWLRSLALPPRIAPRAEQAAQVPWIRFRSAFLAKIGERPLRAL